MMLPRVLRTLRHSLRGLRVWFAFAWQWRPWDWSEAYEAYFLAVRALREHVATHQLHTTWAEDVAEMDQALALWEAYKEDDFGADADAKWAELHGHLAAHARAWWC